jgi:hypothetical protein
MNAGQPVELIATGEKGRICRILPFNQYCVQLQNLGCRRIVEANLRGADEPAPDCTAACTEGC